MSCNHLEEDFVLVSGHMACGKCPKSEGAVVAVMQVIETAKHRALMERRTADAEVFLLAEETIHKYLDM